MSVLRSIARRVRAEDGFTLPELLVASALMLGAIVTIGGFLITMLKGGAFAQGQSVTLNDARTTVMSIEKEIRAADSLVWCAPAGSCLQVDTMDTEGQARTVKYTHTGTELQRSLFDAGTSSWDTPQTVVERVNNGAGEPLFDCDTSSTLLHVTVDLHLRPTPNSDPTYVLRTSIRPRNFPAVAACP